MAERWSIMTNAPMVTGRKRPAADSEAIATKRAASTNEKQQQKKIDAFFQKYADDPSDTLPGQIGPHGVLHLCKDLKVEPTDVCMLVLAWSCKAKVPCEFTREEWSVGMKKIDCTGIRALKQWCTTAHLVLSHPADFKELYKFTYTYAKPVAHKSLLINDAIAYWRLLYGAHAEVEQWITFLESENKLAITGDEWTSFYDFLTTCDINTYDESMAFPIIIDDYVTWRKDQMRMDVS